MIARRLRTPPPRSRAVLVALAAPLLTALVAGCVDLPTNSGVIKDTSQPTSNGGEAVRIWPAAHGPSSTDSPLAVLEGFLQTAASDEPDPDAAQQYLSGHARGSWDPTTVIVFSSESSAIPVAGQPDEFEIKAVEVGRVDPGGRYTPTTQPKQDSYFFHVAGDAKTGYHIDQVPPGFGIPLTQEAFRSYYTPYSVYYLDGQPGTNSMIPDPVYLRAALVDPDAATRLANIVLAGAPSQYDGVAQVAVTGLHLANITITQADVAQVTIKSQNFCLPSSHASCDRLAEELLATFVGVPSISSVDIYDQALGPQVRLGHADNVQEVLAKYHVTLNASKPTRSADFYFIEPPGTKNDPNAGHVMAKLGARTAAVPSQVGPATMKYGQLALGIDGASKQPVLALTDVNGTNLYLGTPGSAAAPALVYSGAGIKSLSWDALGHLWFIATVSGQPSLFRVDTSVDGVPQRQPVIVELPPGDGAIQQVSVAADGRRVALVYTDPGGALALSLGVELNTGSQLYVNLADGSTQPILDGWATIADVEWNSSQTLAILGAEQGSVSSTIAEVFTDGSPVFTPTDLNAVTIVPPIFTASIAWSGSGGLLAAYRDASTGNLQIATYSPSLGSWENPIPGISPSYSF
jgi:hypothetical protein